MTPSTMTNDSAEHPRKVKIVRNKTTLRNNYFTGYVKTKSIESQNKRH